jgi:ATP-binding cassette subfamily F protein 3
MVLRDVYFRLSAGDRAGLIGKNGVGKTTVLKLILGQEDPAEGSVEINQGIKLGYFSQFSELTGDVSVDQFLDGLFEDIHAIKNRLAEIETKLSESPADKELKRLLQRQSELLAEMDHRDGWHYEHRINTVLTKLGFSTAHRTCPIDLLSGGWRNRAALAEILLQEPDVLLLDEPTNYLDVEGLSWLENWFQGHRGAAIVVSHDRHFLDNVVTRVVEIENYRFQEYSGNFTQYVREKRLRLKTLERQFVHEEELLALEAEAVEDRKEARKNPGKALRRKLADIKKRVEPRPVDRIVTSVYGELKLGRVLCSVDSISKGYGSQRLFEDLSLEICRGDKVVIFGPNASGKTTLLEVLTGRVAPDAGGVRWAGSAMPFVYYNQVLDELDPNDSVTHAVNISGLAFKAARKKVNRFLALFQFTEMDLSQKIGTLSGGQQARVALARCLLSGAGVIVLDEPTNHLDLTSTQVMERALTHFPGAVIVVSHDRFFIDKVATRLLVFDGTGGVREVAGNWTTWQVGQDEMQS